LECWSWFWLLDSLAGSMVERISLQTYLAEQNPLELHHLMVMRMLVVPMALQTEALLPALATNNGVPVPVLVLVLVKVKVPVPILRELAARGLVHMVAPLVQTTVEHNTSNTRILLTTRRHVRRESQPQNRQEKSRGETKLQDHRSRPNRHQNQVAHPRGRRQGRKRESEMKREKGKKT
jgi:hypothetical protein